MQMHTNTSQRMEKNTCPRKGLDHLMLAKLCKLQGCLVHRCRIRIGWQQGYAIQKEKKLTRWINFVFGIGEWAVEEGRDGLE